MYAVALSLGAVLLFLGGPFRDRAASPGPLTVAHGAVAESCTSCHATANNGLQSLSLAAIRAHDGLEQSQRCLRCHDLGPDALQAHSQDGAVLAHRHDQLLSRAEATRPALFALAAWAGPGLPGTQAGEFACATCHHEHRGHQANLRFMDNETCQACHARTFGSFTDGHPEFDGYPYHQRTRLAYDHVSHLGRHYEEYRRLMPDGQAPASCLDCHFPDADGRMMRVRGFDLTCATCHLRQIEEPLAGGITFLNLPGIDTETIQVQQTRPGHRGIGYWPRAGGGDPSPFLELLLSTDRDFLEARAHLAGNREWRDLRLASDEQVRAVEQYVWTVKGLVYDLIHQGPPELERRLREVLRQTPSEGGPAPPLDRRQLAALSGDLPVAVLRMAQQAWLPELDYEVQRHRAGERVLRPGSVPVAATVHAARAASGTTEAALGSALVVTSAVDAVRVGKSPAVSPNLSPRWDLDSATFSVVYRPKGHAGDFLRNWLDISGQRYSAGPGHEFQAIFDRLSDRYAPGRCTKCHSVEAVGGRREVRWYAARAESNKHPFTKFAHAVHFSLLDESGCRQCHILNPEADPGRGFLHPDHTLNTTGQGFISSFQGMTKNACTGCHTSEAAGDGCLSCHNYHVGTFQPPRPAAPLGGFERSDGRAR